MALGVIPFSGKGTRNGNCGFCSFVRLGSDYYLYMKIESRFALEDFDQINCGMARGKAEYV